MFKISNIESYSSVTFDYYVKNTKYEHLFKIKRTVKDSVVSWYWHDEDENDWNPCSDKDVDLEFTPKFLKEHFNKYLREHKLNRIIG